MLKHLMAIFAVMLLGLPVSSAWADSCTDAANLFRKAGQSGEFFNTAYGYAVFPTIGKGGVGIGGAFGKGCVYANGKHVGGTTMTQLSIGFQLGGEGYSTACLALVAKTKLADRDREGGLRTLNTVPSASELEPRMKRFEAGRMFALFPRHLPCPKSFST